ncbi:MAG TPA: SDR family oxidoreductase [Spirochaetia bacterium]|nr:SDR family oxidoreductase [Spirochaetia bacterium]
MDNDLTGKTVIVTGASSGIGRATARALVKAGCRVTLAARSTDKLTALATELGSAAFAVPTDVTVAADVTALVSRTISQFGRIDAMFANAGIFIPGSFAEGNAEDWSRTLSVNVEAVFRCIHAVLPHMIARKSGDIIMTSSISGCVDIASEPVYSASKHAIQSFAHTLRQQVAPAGIRVGAVSPGIVLNDIWGITDEQEIERRVAERSGIRSEDVARAVLYMLCEPRHVTIGDLVILPQNQDI